MGTLDEEYYVATLRQWAEWGRAFASRRAPRPDWSAVDALISAAKPRLKEDARDLRELLDRSRNRLKMTDPLVCDLGVHRWLSAEREESYSDWLAWALERLKDAAAVLRLLGIEDLVADCIGMAETLPLDDFEVETVPRGALEALDRKVHRHRGSPE